MLSCLEQTNQSIFRRLDLKTQGIIYSKLENEGMFFGNCEIHLVTFAIAEINCSDKRNSRDKEITSTQC